MTKTSAIQLVRYAADFDCLEELLSALGAVTPEQIIRAGNKLDKPSPKETVLGTLHNETARKLHVCMARFKGREMEAVAKIGTADSDEEERTLHADVHRFERLADFAKSLFWMQVKADMNHEICDNADGIGVRSNWMVVTFAKHNPHDLIQKLFGGGSQIFPIE